jgi:hypothetical protein
MFKGVERGPMPQERKVKISKKIMGMKRKIDKL